MDFKEFKKKIAPSGKDIAREVFFQNQNAMRIKKEKTAINNLNKIFNAVLGITQEKGFQAMSMRDLSKKTDMSLGALYAYFPGKEELLGIIQTQGRSMIKGLLEQFANAREEPFDKLMAVIKAHIFLSESLRPWFFFMFMEARNLKPAELKAVKAMEEHTQKILIDILKQGEKKGIFRPDDHLLTSGMIKAMQQEWYLKRWKYKKYNISVDQYVDHVLTWVEAFCLCP